MMWIHDDGRWKGGEVFFGLGLEFLDWCQWYGVIERGRLGMIVGRDSAAVFRGAKGILPGAG